MPVCFLCLEKHKRPLYCNHEEEHIICPTCIVGETKAALEEGRKPVCRALKQDERMCVAEYDTSEILSILKSTDQENMADQLDKFYLEMHLAGLQLFKCFRCEVKYQVDPSVDYITCLNCETSCCPRCEFEHHAGKSCAQAKLDDANRPRKKFVEEQATEGFVIRCPCNPDRPLIKESQCNKLKCPTCDKFWCWYCKKAIEGVKPYEHFGTSMGLCALWAEPVTNAADASNPQNPEPTASESGDCTCTDTQADGNLIMCNMCLETTCRICEQCITVPNPYQHFDKFGGRCRFRGHPVDCFQSRAEDGDADAQIEMGLIFQEGRDGVPKNFQRSRTWFEKAVDSELMQGYASYRMACLWMERAAEHMHPAACRAVEYLRMLNSMTTPSPVSVNPPSTPLAFSFSGNPATRGKSHRYGRRKH